MSAQFYIELKNKLKTEALNLGFTNIGICDPNSPSSFPIFLDWLEKGHEAGMSYLSRKDTIEKRKDPKLILCLVLRQSLYLHFHIHPQFQKKNLKIGGKLPAMH